MTLTQDQSAPASYENTVDWDLSDLLPEPSEKVISERIARMWEAVEAFEEKRELLSPQMEPQVFLDLLREYESLLDHMDILGGYASLWFATNTQDGDALGYRNRVRQLLSEVDNRTLFFTLWWKRLPEDKAERLLPTAEAGCTPQELQDFGYYLRDLRRFSPYTLDERSEQIINTKNTNGVEALVTLYQMLINRLEFYVEIDGVRKTLTDGEMRSLFYSPDARMRAEVCQELLRVYKKEKSVIAQIYANRVRDWHSEYVEMRGLATPIAIRNLADDVPDEAVATLLEVVRKNVSIFREYFELKANWLGMKKLRRYDVYAPLTTSSQEIPYGEAVATVLDTFYTFHDRIGQLAERIFIERHIDSEIRKGKKAGAFCATISPRLTPWVMVNYTGKVRDIATLAHELGHAVHSMMAADHSLLTQHPPLPLAETGSIFGEMLMTDRLLKSQRDPVTRRELLAAAMDDIYATVLRQTFFVCFELDAHKAVLENATADVLCDLYEANLAEQFGDSVDVAPEFRYEWLSIPHFFSTPFYCYAYSFGQLLVLALYQRYLEEGEAFKPGYLRLLSYGGSESPAKVLSESGIDITDAGFWQGGFEVVRGMLDELKAL